MCVWGGGSDILKPVLEIGKGVHEILFEWRSNGIEINSEGVHGIRKNVSL